MPVAGFPDPERHCLCKRCYQWFFPDEGDWKNPEDAGPWSRLVRLTAWRGRQTQLQFQCRRCTRIRRITQGVIYGGFLTIITIILILEHFGMIPRSK
jgi:hypothetical protein